MAKRIPVLVVEDNRLVRDAIIAVLAEQPDLKVVAAVDGAAGALERVRQVRPEVVVLDAALGDHGSHRLVAEIKPANRDDVLLVPEDLHDFANAGASGFIAKDATLGSRSESVADACREQ